MFYSLWLCIIIAMNIFALLVSGKEICNTCQGIVNKMHEGIKKTSKSNFGGGNTRWEEESLGKYVFSETRLLEILEEACDSSDKDCHRLVEEHEETMEMWWFREFAKGKDTDLFQYFCIDNVKVCCPSGTFGPQCDDCLGGRARFCNGNGNCMGNGTREGTGKCSCFSGYQGDMCDECKEGYFEETRNETHIICTICDRACKTGCYEGGAKGCDDCKDGWEFKEDEGCFDINECDKEDSCNENEYCTNTQGSYKCQACDKSCNGCTGSGPGNCVTCNERYFKDDTTCKACHVSCLNSCIDGTEYMCDECKDGWIKSEDGACVDVDECETQPNPCTNEQLCKNTQGSYDCINCHSSCQGCTGVGNEYCITCKQGFKEVQQEETETKICEDINECEDDEICPEENETCINKPGSYKCVCKEGFERKGKNCFKVDKTKKANKKSNLTKKGKKNKKNPKPADENNADEGSKSSDVGDELDSFVEPATDHLNAQNASQHVKEEL